MKEEWIKVVGWEFSSTWQQVKCTWFWQEKLGNRRSAKCADPCSWCHWVGLVTPGERDMSGLVSARAALEDWVSNDTQCPEPEPEAESGVRYNNVTLYTPYIRTLSCQEWEFFGEGEKLKFHKELLYYFWQPWSGMLWLVSARSNKLSGDCRNFDTEGSHQSR